MTTTAAAPRSCRAPYRVFPARAGRVAHRAGGGDAVDEDRLAGDVAPEEVGGRAGAHPTPPRGRGCRRSGSSAGPAPSSRTGSCARPPRRGCRGRPGTTASAGRTPGSGRPRARARGTSARRTRGPSPRRGCRLSGPSTSSGRRGWRGRCPRPSRTTSFMRAPVDGGVALIGVRERKPDVGVLADVAVRIQAARLGQARPRRDRGHEHRRPDNRRPPCRCWSHVIPLHPGFSAALATPTEHAHRAPTLDAARRAALDDTR